MDHNAFFNQLKLGRIGRCYLFDGEEEYVKHEAWRQLYQALMPDGLEALNYSALHNPDTEELIMACETLPMMCERRLVTVYDYTPLSAPKRKDSAEEDVPAKGSDASLTEYIGRLPDTVCLVFYVKGKADSRKALAKAIEKLQGHVVFDRLNESECCRWVKSQAKKAGYTLAQDMASYLVFTVGSDVSALKQELDKLFGYAQEHGTITAEDIDAICTKSTECTVFQMVDAQVDGRTDTAFILLNNLLYAGEDRMMVLAMLLRQYRLMYHVRRLTDEKVPSSSYAQLLGIAPFAAERTRRQAVRFPAEKLKAAYDYLLDYEYRIKQGAASQTACAENAMLQLEQILRG